MQMKGTFDVAAVTVHKFVLFVKETIYQVGCGDEHGQKKKHHTPLLSVLMNIITTVLYLIKL